MSKLFDLLFEREATIKDLRNELSRVSLLQLEQNKQLTDAVYQRDLSDRTAKKLAKDLVRAEKQLRDVESVLAMPGVTRVTATVQPGVHRISFSPSRVKLDLAILRAEATGIKVQSSGAAAFHPAEVAWFTVPDSTVRPEHMSPPRVRCDPREEQAAKRRSVNMTGSREPLLAFDPAEFRPYARRALECIDAEPDAQIVNGHLRISATPTKGVRIFRYVTDAGASALTQAWAELLADVRYRQTYGTLRHDHDRKPTP